MAMIWSTIRAFREASAENGLSEVNNEGGTGTLHCGPRSLHERDHSASRHGTKVMTVKSTTAKSASKSAAATSAKKKTAGAGKTSAKPAAKAKGNGKPQTASAERPADAIKLLKADHKEVKAWFKQYETLDANAEKQALADKICTALTVHAQIEEEIFYPAARGAIDEDDLFDEAEVEHGSAKQLIAEIQSMKVGDRLFDAKVIVLGEYIDHHVQEEEEEMFPEARDSDLDLKELGVKLAARKAELMAEVAQ